MSTIFRSAAIRGIIAQQVEIEARREIEHRGLSVVGLPDTACRESRERVRAAISALTGEELTNHVIVSLAPADVRKEGSGFDLAICLAVLVADGRVNFECASPDLTGAIFLGELTLGGNLRPVRGTVAAAELARREKRMLVLPRAAAPLASLVPGVRLVAVDSLSEVVALLRGLRSPRPLSAEELAMGQGAALRPGARAEDGEDFREVRGQPQAVRAALIAAAGAHDLLLVGPPGCGKSMIARRLPGILPELDNEEFLEVACVRTAAAAISSLPLRRRPFRAPHHTTSTARLVGGGSPPQPGEVSLAHRGVLFLDEFPEFSRDAINALREPLEIGYATISRVRGSATFPSRFQLVAAMNPCPCGWHGDLLGRCRCTPQACRLYAARVSGPVRDRIDLHVNLEPVRAAALEGGAASSSDSLRAQVERARTRQRERLARPGRQGTPTSARMTVPELERHARLDSDSQKLLNDAIDCFGLSARGRFRALVVSRTIADLAESDRILRFHLQEALSFRAIAGSGEGTPAGAQAGGGRK